MDPSKLELEYILFVLYVYVLHVLNLSMYYTKSNVCNVYIAFELRGAHVVHVSSGFYQT